MDTHVTRLGWVQWREALIIIQGEEQTRTRVGRGNMIERIWNVKLKYTRAGFFYLFTHSCSNELKSDTGLES